MTDASTDGELLERSLDDPQAFAPLVERHFAAVHRYLHRRAGRDIADELAAQAFAVAFAQRSRCRTSEGSALPWLYGIATRLLRRSRRTEARRLRAYARSGVDAHVEYEDEAAERLAASSRGPELAAALAALPAHERDALLLYALGDLSYAEIALALDVPIGTVRTWLHRGRERTRRRLGGDEPAPRPFPSHTRS